MLRVLRSKSRSIGRNVRGLAMLVEGRPLEWEESIEHLEYVRKHGIHQFVNTWNRVKSLSNEKLLWGEETEMSILHMSPDTMEVKLSLRGAEVRDQLNEAEASFLENGGNVTEAATYVFFLYSRTQQSNTTLEQQVASRIRILDDRVDSESTVFRILLGFNKSRSKHA